MSVEGSPPIHLISFQLHAMPASSPEGPRDGAQLRPYCTAFGASMNAADLDPDISPWLILRCLRMSEERMTVWLAGLASLGFETYYPMIRELRQVPKRELSRAQRTSSVSIMRPRVAPFLPQMVFIRGGGGYWLSAHPGVIGFVTFGGEPALVSHVIITRLRARGAAGDGGAIPGATPVEYIFSPGDSVEIVDGPLASRTATVDATPSRAIEDIDADTRLRLTIDIFGQKTKVTMPVSSVRKVI